MCYGDLMRGGQMELRTGAATRSGPFSPGPGLAAAALPSEWVSASSLELPTS
jgi:hypothetical protein